MSAQIADHMERSSGSRAIGLIAEVLVVDDNPIDRLRAGRLIEQDWRCHARYAEDGTRALASLADHCTSVVLIGLQREGMDGLNLVRAIRNEYPKVPVIVMTGHGSEDVAMEALRVGATDYVPKQRLAQDLHAVLARALRTATAGSRRRRCLQSLVARESRFELGNDPDLIPPLLEFLQDEMTQLDRWDGAELMRTTIALDEALRNALFHGNLEVSSELREEDDRRYVELARQRAAQSPYQNRRIRFLIAHDSELSRFVIRDEGCGFDTSRAHRPIEPEDLLSPSGRGLLLMKSFMDSVTFNQAGNEVTLVKRRTANFPLPLPGKPGGMIANGPAPAVESMFTPSPDQGKTTTINGTACRGNGKQMPALTLPRTSRGPVLLDSDFYKRLLDQLHDAVVFVDTERTILYWNEAAERLTGFSPSEVIGRHCFDASLDPGDRFSCTLCHKECPLTQSIKQDCPVHERLFLRHKDGRRISVDARIMPVRKDDGTVLGSVEVFCDATSSVVVESAFRQIREAADRDPLTGLANRRYLDRMLAHHLENLDRSGQPFSVIMSDLDHFKQINDTWGHVIGDQALAQFAAVLQNQCRPVDLVARFGGEEFVVLLPGLTLETAVQIAERLRKCAVRATPEKLGERNLTASFGVTQAALGEPASQVLSRADTALYRAKSLGRDRVEVEACQ
jgi:diguanylate cyclase (GGDEF)-like protein/PAS domain S-box-containing protein